MITNPIAECILGLKVDPQFGPVILFGIGGIAVELYQDIVLRIPPINEQEAYKMLTEIKAYKLLMGFRGKPKADLKALVRAIMSLCEIATTLGHVIEEIDINPLMVFKEGFGVKAVDALFKVK
jgi:acetyltransferase